MNNSLINFVTQFCGQKVGVIGDAMLDHFIFGDSDRISPEAPVPVVVVEKELFLPGGAGNVASNIASLGGKVFLQSLVGGDQAGKTLLRVLERRHVNTAGIYVLPDHLTTQKVRVVVVGQQMLRMDREKPKFLSRALEKKVLDFVSKNIAEWKVLVISDYAKGCLTKFLAEKLIKLAKQHAKPVIVDTKPQHAGFYKDVYLFTPNQKEAHTITGADNVSKMGKALQRMLRSNVLITRGSQGMTLFEKSKVTNFPTHAQEVFDVVGAGDTVVATMALALAAGANLGQATMLANYAAAIVVRKLGTAVVSDKELIAELSK